MYASSKRTISAFAAALVLTAAAGAMAGADILHHKDGTSIEGKIIHETPDLVRIETSYGTLSYPKEDLTTIERRAAAYKVPTPRANYATVIPAGPVNPVSPPQVPPLVRFTAKPTATTTSTAPAIAPLSPAAIPTPVAPAVPAGTPSLPGTAVPATPGMIETPALP